MIPRSYAQVSPPAIHVLDWDRDPQKSGGNPNPKVRATAYA